MFINDFEDSRVHSEASFLEYALDRQSWRFVSRVTTLLAWSRIFALNRAPVKSELNDYFGELPRGIKR